MEFCISVEGPDGVGKGVVIDELLRLGKEKARVVCSLEKRSSPLMSKLSDLIALDVCEEDLLSDFWLDEANLYARMARDLLKARLAIRDTSHLVVMDRFVLSTVAHGLTIDSSGYVRALVLDFANHIHSLFDGRHIVFMCTAPFDLCWDRVHKRDQPLSKKELRGVEFNQRYYNAMTRDALSVFEKREIVMIDTSDTIEHTQRQVASKLAGLELFAALS